MSSRKRSNSSQDNRNDQKKRKIRSQESEGEHKARLIAVQERQTQTRTSETSTQHESRPSTQRFKLRNAGFTYSPSNEYPKYASIGAMDVICKFCKAQKWRNEPKNICCSNGKVRIDNFQDPPEPLRSLLTGDHSKSKTFLENINSYNCKFQMTSFGAKKITKQASMSTFTVHAQVYHLLQQNSKYLEIYFVSDHNECPQLNGYLISQLQSMLRQSNTYVRRYKPSLESISPEQCINYKLEFSADRRPVAEHRSMCNAPANEVAVVLVDQKYDKRDIVLHTLEGRLKRISETDRTYDALKYPLIYCHGENGHYFGLYQVNPTTGRNSEKKISAQQYYSYLLQIRNNNFIYLQRFRGLFRQFIVDMYAKIETQRLEHASLRVENNKHLRNAVQQGNNVENLGRLVILPSNFPGSSHYMHERTQDALCYVRKYGRPDLFITFTANPNWSEITQELLTEQSSYDRIDIVARVFYLKLKLMIELITKKKLFGSTTCFMYSVEWQKCGLPHAHILLWLQEKIPQSPHIVDKIISAEFPDHNDDPTLHEIVKTYMVHGPCGDLNKDSPCMKEGQCSKRYPRALLKQTMSVEDGYPLYRRRSPQQGGSTVTVRLHGRDVSLDNSWVIPYSPVLSSIFQAHINIEMCNRVKAIEKLCKYVNKGIDQAMFKLRNNENDEVTRSQYGRYISSSEAVWRILGFPINKRSPPIQKLDVHLENEQPVYYHPKNELKCLENPRQTTLLAFFRLCETDNFAKRLLYEEVPLYYTYDKKRGVFNRRCKGIAVDGEPGLFKKHVIGRVYTPPTNSECYYLQLLLHTVQGPTSFVELRKFDGIEYSTYRAACRARHLLDDDQNWDITLAEACISDSPHRLRHLFAILLKFCELSDAVQLWQKYQDKLAEDFLRIERLNNNGELNNRLRENTLNKCLLAIQDIISSMKGNSLSEYGMPVPTSDGKCINRDYVAETNYNQKELAKIWQNEVATLTDEQRKIFNRVCDSVDGALGHILFLDAPSGTGKTFLTKVILAKIRNQNKIALAVASSGMAATLLPGGKTAHAMFNIPFKLDGKESPVCNISRNSDKAKVLHNCSLIIWDECTMTNRKAVEAVDRTLRDLRQNNQPMGGVTVLFCGDFRQILPVIPQGKKADEIKASLKSSSLWRHVKPMHLSVNMRARTGGYANAQEFSSLLLKIGDGTYPKENGKVVLRDDLCCTVSSVQDLISSVYGDLTQITNHKNSWLCERVILTPRNDEAEAINDKILACAHGESKEYISIDKLVDKEHSNLYPIESHKIKLKIGTPIILLRNLNPQLCNGTRLKVKNLQENVIEAEILTGCGAGDIVFIPRIPTIQEKNSVRFKRIQFPVSLCYAMTIHKAQGQTLRVAGVDLSNSCFSHGQLYVALSRVSKSSDLYVHIPSGSTANIVYREALL